MATTSEPSAEFSDLNAVGMDKSSGSYKTQIQVGSVGGSTEGSGDTTEARAAVNGHIGEGAGDRDGQDAVTDKQNGDMGSHGSKVNSYSPNAIPLETHEKFSGNNNQRKDIDDLLPATKTWTTVKNGTVKLRMSDTGPGAWKPVTIPTVFKNTVQKAGDHLALAVKREGRWIKWSYRQYYEDSRRAAKSFIKLGLEPNNGVGILGFNSPEWYISYMAAIFAGGNGVGIYTTNTSDACAYVLGDCEANVMVVENHAQLEKILAVWDKLPALHAIVQYTGEVAQRQENIYSWQEFMELGKDVPDSDLEDRLCAQAPNTCASLIYTSGTTGNPKAVMLSHDNCTYTAEATARYVGIAYATEISVSFLPLSHIAAQMLDILIPLKSIISIYFAQPDALKGTIVETWKEVRPTTVFLVPRVYEKLVEKMQAQGQQVTGLKRKIGIWAKEKGKIGTEAQINGKSLPFGWSLANILVFKKVRKLLGLDRCRLFSTGAAPIMKATVDYLASLNIRLDEVYGMSECTGPHTFSTDSFCKLYSLGKEMPGVMTKLDNPDEEGNGEVCMWGRHVFMGYLNSEEKTRETIQDDDWLHSGDIGKKDDEGYLYITGRIKELVITAGGENVAPVPIEDSVKFELPVISNCMLIGDKLKYLSMLISLKVDVNLDTMEPTDTLMTVAKDWCASMGSQATTVTEAMQDKLVLQGIQAGIDKANEKAVSRAARVQKFSIIPRDFSVPGGELGPTLKLRRRIVVKMYEKTIADLYAEQ